MKTQEIGSEDKLLSIASSVNTDRRSWKDWSALHIHAPDITTDDFHDVRLSTTAIVESYLQDIEGTTYFCRNQHIFIVCKSIPDDVLEQVSNQITELSFDDVSASPSAQVFKLGSDDNGFAQNVFMHLKGEEPPTHSEENTAASKGHEHLKILLVEDDPVTRWIVRNAIKDECDFASADCANKVFSVYPEYDPDIVLLDIGLPDQSGHSVLDWIVENDPESCVVMMSSQADLETIPKCMERGAKGFIPKPFVKDNLIEYIKKHGQSHGHG